jgi:hypothetical protein
MISLKNIGRTNAVKAATVIVTALGAVAFVSRPQEAATDLPNRIPEAAPYLTSEAQVFPPPYEEYWATQNHPGQCANCHRKIFDEWNGSMMSNSWRDPVWRAAFLLLARAVSTNGECDTPAPPDGTPKATHNPFALPGQCASAFDIGTSKVTVSRPGSLLDAFCSRCHMPTNYVDNVPLRNVKLDAATGIESAPVDTNFNPTSDNGTGVAFATVESQFRNTDTGKAGIFCAVCHSYATTRDTPFHNYVKAPDSYTPAIGRQARDQVVQPQALDVLTVSDPSKRNLGYAIGAGSYRLSPHALAFPERIGPLLAGDLPPRDDDNTSSVFGHPVPYQQLDASKHKGMHSALYVRAEMCAACHDVTNALPIKNPLGRWVGGFPIERTYTEWLSSRYADRPGNANFDPRFKRDCQSCHMQQDYGQPGTANTLYKDGKPLPIPSEPVATDGKPRPSFTHHFVGGNAMVPHLIGKDVDATGVVAPYPELSTFSFSSADHKSPYSRGFWTNTERKGGYAQQQRLAWDRLRNVLSLTVRGPTTAAAGSRAPLAITVANTGSGHNFPTGFPEGRIAWVAVHAIDLGTGNELKIRDSFWKRSSVGVGNLTTKELVDPAFPGCDWKLPAGSADPFSIQFKAVASLGDGCPTLDLPYAAPLNMVTNARGLPIDEGGRVIDAASNPRGLPQFKDANGNGDLFDDSFLRDSRLRPMPHPGATQSIDRYAVEIPEGTVGPIAVSAAVYYQSVEAIVAGKFLGNMVDQNVNFVIEPCVLGGLCDGRVPHSEPAVVEGAPPVPMIVRNWVIPIDGAVADRTPPRLASYPEPGARNVYPDAVVKVSFSEPVSGVDARTFTLTDAAGAQVPAAVDQIGPGSFGLFAHRVLLQAGATYTAHLAAGVADAAGNRTTEARSWTFTIAADADHATGNTAVPETFSIPSQPVVLTQTTKRSSTSAKGKRHGHL